MKSAGLLAIGVVIGYYVGTHYEFEFEAKERDSE